MYTLQIVYDSKIKLGLHVSQENSIIRPYTNGGVRLQRHIRFIKCKMSLFHNTLKECKLSLFYNTYDILTLIPPFTNCHGTLFKLLVI